MNSQLEIKTIAKGFLNYLRTQKKMHLLPAIIGELASKKVNLAKVVVESAQLLSISQKKQLAKKFKKPIIYILNPEILGGLRITDGDLISDLSLKTQLDTLVSSVNQ